MLIQSGYFTHRERNKSELTVGDTSSFERYKFATPFPRGVKPIVIPFIQTFGGPNTPDIRIADVDEKGFLFRIQEVVVCNPGVSALSDGPHLPEVVGFIAVAPAFAIKSKTK